MRLTYVTTATTMTTRELARKRLVLVLALCLPALFFATAFATTSDDLAPVVLATRSRFTLIAESSRALLFISIAAAGVISAFFASYLIQRQLDANRRLVLCGFRASELIAARFSALLGIIAATALYVWLSLGVVVGSLFPAGVLLGIALAAFVYGSFGLLVGTLFRRELESIFAIVVLLNIDAGWLQNPVYYQGATSKWLIHALPAHYPSQIAFLAASTDEPLGPLVAKSLAYGTVFLLAAVAVYSARMRVTR